MLVDKSTGLEFDGIKLDLDGSVDLVLDGSRIDSILVDRLIVSVLDGDSVFVDGKINVGLDDCEIDSVLDTSKLNFAIVD